MGRFTRGDVVWLPFPFSDLTSAKDRPALVIASFSGDDMLLCQITAAHSDIYSSNPDGAGFLFLDLADSMGRCSLQSVGRTNRAKEFGVTANVGVYIHRNPSGGVLLQSNIIHT
jgi:hypothetical protein